MDKSVKFTLLTALSLSIIFFLWKLFMSGTAYCEIKGVHIDRTTILVGESIMVTDSSEGVKSREWDFGDGTEKGIDKSMKHTYTKEGEYPLVLTINNNCTFDTLIKVLSGNTSAPNYDGLAIVGPLENQAQVNKKLSFKVNKSGFTSYDWTFGENGAGTIDKSLANTHEANYTYSVPGTYTVYLTVDRTHTISKSIKISAGNQGAGPNPEKIRSLLQLMFSSSSEPEQVDRHMISAAGQLCKNRSVQINFKPGLKMETGKIIDNIQLKGLSNSIGMSSFYKNVRVSKVTISKNSGACPEIIDVSIVQ